MNKFKFFLWFAVIMIFASWFNHNYWPATDTFNKLREMDDLGLHIYTTIQQIGGGALAIVLMAIFEFDFEEWIKKRIKFFMI